MCAHVCTITVCVQWEKSVRHGKGVLTMADGAVYRGNFANDIRVGMASYWFPNGDRMKVNSTVLVRVNCVACRLRCCVYLKGKSPLWL